MKRWSIINQTKEIHEQQWHQTLDSSAVWFVVLRVGILGFVTLVSIREKPKAGLDAHMELLRSPCMFMLLNICWK